jgi:hypothetical protein
MVFGCCTKQGNTSNVNLLDGIVNGASGLGDGIRERI